MALTTPADRFRAAADAITPARLVVLLYERLARDLDDAEAAMATDDRFTVHRSLLHAQEIVAELDGALDATVWDGAPQLSEVYRFLTGRLIMANIRQDRAALADCRSVVAPLLDTWTDAWQQNAAGAPTLPDTAELPVRAPLDIAG